MHVSISSEGSDALRDFAEAAYHASDRLARAMSALEASFCLVADRLGPQREDYRRMMDVLRAGTMSVIESSEYLALGLVDTADAIDEFLYGDSVVGDLQALIASAGSPEAELAHDLRASANYTADHITVDALDRIRGADMRPRKHRHPMSFGRWTLEDGTPIDASEVGDAGTYLWYPNPGHVFGGASVNPSRLMAAEVMDKYGFDHIVFANGYPVFPSSTVMAEVGMPTLLTTDRPSNFSAAWRAMTEGKLLGCLDLFVTDRLREMIGEFLRERGSSSDWFQTASDIRSFLSTCKLTWHEREDMMTMQLIPSEVHSMFVHDGGVSNADYRESLAADFELLAQEAFKWLLP